MKPASQLIPGNLNVLPSSLPIIPSLYHFLRSFFPSLLVLKPDQRETTRETGTLAGTRAR